MARHHTFLERLFDLKPYASAVSTALLGWHPALRRSTGYFPDFAWPADRAQVISDETRRHRLYAPGYDAARAIVMRHNADVMNGLETACTEDTTRTMIAGIGDVLIPGHTVIPADFDTGRQVALGQRGQARWAFCHPAPIGFRKVVVRERCLAIPPVFHYGHLLTDVLMPICEAVRVGAIDKREETVFVTASHPPLVAAFLDGLKALGYPIRQLVLRATDHVVAERYLYARSHCPNIERIFGVPQALDTARAIFRAAYRGHPVTPPASKLYLRRRNQRLRVVEGEDALVERLERAGFRIFEPGWGNHAEQMAAISGADVVTAVHGAALANTIFCKPGATVVELMASTSRKSTVLHWASEGGAGYVPILGGPEGSRQSFAIDPAATAEAILRAVETAPRLPAGGRDA
ncbi:glycosyltransferase family 61 protein [Methylobacterium sp. E-045]|uniref:glycosyltransferase family 61 protein n=1 Tax=Methylobacterium sp. E-045 TaxID=2836575 RepID=UPI001FBBB137|nr:glycosyltransferase 61 family protein [Methylobacterium sp. E-045]MCJ2131091.1 glycosyltransferase family 61 protein [Methylobacterium sp. E-045]